MHRYISKSRTRMVITIAIVIITLWFAGILPLKVAEGMASFYMSKQENTFNYSIVDASYSHGNDCYLITFTEDGIFSNTRVIGVYYRYLPIKVFYDSRYPG